MLGQAVSDDLSPCCQMFAFSRCSQRSWEVRCPAFLLAEAASQRLYCRLQSKDQRSAAAFLVWTGLLQNSENQTCKLGCLGLLRDQCLCESCVTVYLSEMSLWGSYLQCFVFVICQDLVIGFQTVSAKKQTKKRIERYNYPISRVVKATDGLFYIQSLRVNEKNSTRKALQTKS